LNELDMNFPLNVPTTNATIVFRISSKDKTINSVGIDSYIQGRYFTINTTNYYNQSNDGKEEYLGVKQCSENLLNGKLKYFFCPDIESIPIIGSPLDDTMIEFTLKIKSCNNLQ
jgi:hypothetical protein